MQIYKHEIKPCYVIADIHGCFDKFENFLIHNINQYKNSIIICAGDIGVGFRQHSWYVTKFSKINTILVDNDILFYGIRGNHDDKSYFDNDLLNLSNFRLISDYSIIVVGDINILCVGGAISIDRRYRILNDKSCLSVFNMTKNERLIAEFKPSYWESEKPVYDKKSLTEITKLFQINHIITHTSPSFSFKNDTSGIRGWLSKDVELSKDMSNERKVFDRIYNYMTKHHNITSWVYGHFHEHYEEIYNNIQFIALHNFDYKEDVYKLC